MGKKSRTGSTKRAGMWRTMESVDVLANRMWTFRNVAAEEGDAGKEDRVRDSNEDQRSPEASQNVATNFIFGGSVGLSRADAASGVARNSLDWWNRVARFCRRWLIWTSLSLMMPSILSPSFQRSRSP